MVVAVILFCRSLVCAAGQSEGLFEKETILEKIGVTRGICVVLGDANCKLALELARDSDLLIYVQLPPSENIEKACQAVDDAGFYGTRIFIEKGALSKLHLADNLADAMIAPAVLLRKNEAAGVGISEAEALRVLRPGGKAIIGDKF